MENFPSHASAIPSYRAPVLLQDKLKNNDTDFIEKAKKAAQVLLEPGPNGEVSKSDLILGKFKDLLKIFVED